jgi:uncharacterized protein (TIGR03067 family)
MTSAGRSGVVCCACAPRSLTRRLDTPAVAAMHRGMNRCFLRAVVRALWTFAFTLAARADDLKALAGIWKVETMEIGGKPVESEEMKALVVKIEGDRYEVTTKDGMDAGTVKVDETQKPKTMDATDTEGDDVGKVIRAIYELMGDKLRVCYALDGSARPTEFATREGSPWLLVTYQREKQAK